MLLQLQNHPHRPHFTPKISPLSSHPHRRPVHSRRPQLGRHYQRHRLDAPQADTAQPITFASTFPHGLLDFQQTVFLCQNSSRKSIFGFFWKTCLNRPADSLRCLPVTAVRPVLYLNLQSNYTKFLHFVPFCFFRWRTAVSCFSSIDRFQLVCFAKVAACPPI